MSARNYKKSSRRLANAPVGAELGRAFLLWTVCWVVKLEAFRIDLQPADVRNSRPKVYCLLIPCGNSAIWSSGFRVPLFVDFSRRIRWIGPITSWIGPLLSRNVYIVDPVNIICNYFFRNLACARPALLLSLHFFWNINDMICSWKKSTVFRPIIQGVDGGDVGISFGVEDVWKWNGGGIISQLLSWRVPITGFSDMRTGYNICVWKIVWI